jgi:hypothetical protein
MIMRDTQRAEFKRSVLVQQKEYADLFATLSIQRNALDERIQLIHRTIDDLRARGIPISRQDLHIARTRLEQYTRGKHEVLQQLTFVDQHLRQLEEFMKRVGGAKARRRW